MKSLALFASLYLTLFTVLAGGSSGFHTADSFILDQSGRRRIFHGVNFVEKQFPWYPQELLDSSYVSSLAKHGLNFVRLGMMWSGVEPEPRKYNTTYLTIMKGIVALLEENQIFVLLDMHQDVLSSRTGTYDGIPAWLYDRFPPPTHSFPWPWKTTPTGDNWFINYLSEACSHGFQCLYDNVADAAVYMSDFWRLIASTYKQYSNVLGYEIINEPWAGNYLTDPTLLLPGVAGAINLQPFYDKMAKAIRSADNETLIFYEPVTWGVRFNGQHFGTGFRHVPGGDDYRNRSVLSYHYYCLVLSLIPIPGDRSIPIFDRVLCDDIEGPALFQSVERELAQVGGSSFLTEFGGCDGSPVCDEQLEWGLSAADQFLQPWAFWGNGYHSEQTMQRLSRVYARAIAGKPLSMQYIASERLFYLSFYIDPDIQQPTEIYIPAIQFPDSSYLVTVNAVLQWAIDPENKNLILIQPNRQHVTSGSGAIIGVVEIRAKT